MNYTLNRPLLDGTSPARLKEVGAIAPKIKDYKNWYSAWLTLAKTAEGEKRYLDAASYYHGAEFYLPAGDVRNALYDDFARNWALGMKTDKAYEQSRCRIRAEICRVFESKPKGKRSARLSSTVDMIPSSRSFTTSCFLLRRWVS